MSAVVYVARFSTATQWERGNPLVKVWLFANGTRAALWVAAHRAPRMREQAAKLYDLLMGQGGTPTAAHLCRILARRRFASFSPPPSLLNLN